MNKKWVTRVYLSVLINFDFNFLGFFNYLKDIKIVLFLSIDVMNPVRYSLKSSK